MEGLDYTFWIILCTSSLCQGIINGRTFKYNIVQILMTLKMILIKAPLKKSSVYKHIMLNLIQAVVSPQQLISRVFYLWRIG